jgi:hypothetical protein
MGSAKVVISGTDVAFEVNHPGGYCWGAGTSLQVTPDIVGGDIVSLTFADGSQDETTTSSMTASDMVQNGTTVTVAGSFGADVEFPTQMEQRIINADLRDLVGKRDVRALPGPVVPAPTGGYSSGLEIDTTARTFLATYEFDTLEAAQVTAASDLGERAMYWQVEDADANRQGLTIAEFGEAGGPGMGGCPAGPADQAAPNGTASVVRSADGRSIVAKWTPATAQPGADAVTGYHVEAIGATADANGQFASVGKRTGSGATQTTLTGLDPAENYSVEVRSLAGTKMSVPFTPASTGTGSGDTTPPTLTLSPAATEGGVTQADSVTIDSNGQVFFTTNGDPVLTGGDMPSDSAQFYTGPIPITALTTLKVAALDVSNLVTTAEGVFEPKPPAAKPAAPTGLTGTKTQNSVALTWNASTDTTVTGYQVTVYDAAGVKLASQPPVTSVPKQTITGLTADTSYQFAVQAKNVSGLSDESSRITLKTDPLTDRITITSAKWKSGDFRIVGTGSKVGAVVQLYRVNADGSQGAIITGARALVVAAAPPGIGDWDIRLRNAAALPSNPGRIMAVSDGGGVTPPFTVTNG